MKKKKDFILFDEEFKGWIEEALLWFFEEFPSKENSLRIVMYNSDNYILIGTIRKLI